MQTTIFGSSVASRRLRHTALSVALTVGVPGCSPDAKVRGEVAGVEVALSHGKAESLSSGDPGRTLVLRDYGAECNGPAEVGDHLLNIGLQMAGPDVSSEVPAGKYKVGENDVAGLTVLVAASFQVNGSGEFHLATEGSVEIDSSSASAYSGTLDLGFADGGQLTGRFDLETCDRP